VLHSASLVMIVAECWLLRGRIVLYSVSLSDDCGRVLATEVKDCAV
jgi:hypothetical protein